MWKPLVGQQVSRQDLEGVDGLFYQFLTGVQERVESGSRRVCSVAPHLVNLSQQHRLLTLLPSPVQACYFTVPRSDGVVVPLRPGGARERVTPDNLAEYIALAERYRLREFKSQVDAIARGLYQLVPMRAVRLLTWHELQTQCCGTGEVDVDLMQRHTTYVKYNPTERVVRDFWAIMQEFTQEERVLFLKFCWGRTRLPAAGRWGNQRKFKLSKLVKRGTNDATLPTAHTCFFNVELPPYSSRSIMKKRLLTAMWYSTGFTGNA